MALRNYPTGGLNTGVGAGALSSLSVGNQNVALGNQAGSQLTNGVLNVHLANPGLAVESNTIRLGTGGDHTRLFLAGVRGVTTGANDAVTIGIDSLGQLGTISSSRRTKQDITDLGDVGLAVQRLRPVQFRYIKPFADGSQPIQYGLVAEEVEQVLPELVAHDTEGQPETVKYHVLPALLVAEVQRLERARAVQEDRLTTQAAEAGGGFPAPPFTTAPALPPDPQIEHEAGRHRSQQRVPEAHSTRPFRTAWMKSV
jgi:hypothetical protein